MHHLDYLERQFYRECVSRADKWWTLGSCLFIVALICLVVWGGPWLGAKVAAQIGGLGR